VLYGLVAMLYRLDKYNIRYDCDEYIFILHRINDSIGVITFIHTDFITTDFINTDLQF
jgi:hypothetical protein